MRVLSYLVLLLMFSVASGQTPTILQGDYISNVFGNSNFVLNPNAQTSNCTTSGTITCANVTVATAQVTRVTTTPLVARSEFNVAITSANGTATWALRTFDAGMKGQNCEARFSYRGFAATSKVHIKQGANTVATLNLTPATDPRIASINFPCGDLSAATTFQVTDTAILGGVNEIGGIYVGLATNMANVAQAEFVGSLAWPNTATSDSRASITWEAFQTLGSVDPTVVGSVTSPNRAPRVTIPNLKAGNYRITFVGNFLCFSATNVDTHCAYRITDGTTQFGTQQAIRSLGAISGNQGQATTVLEFDFQYSGATTSKTFQLEAIVNATTTNSRIENGPTLGALQISVYRFPSSSELVVTPERQNTWAGVVYTAESQNLFAASAEPTAYSSFNNATWNQPTKLKGKAAVTTTNSGNDLGFSVANLPVGNYKLTISGVMNAVNGADAYTRCNYKIVETTTSTDVAKQVHQDMSFAAGIADETRDYTNSFFGVFNNASVATRNFRLEAQKFEDTTTGNAGYCQAFSGSTSNTYNSNLAFLLEPLDQPSNSALYVQGPVQAAATGAAIPASYVGEILEANDFVSTTSATYNLLSLALTPGVWDVQGKCGFTRNGATITDPNWIVSIVNQNANPDTQALTQLSGSAYASISDTGIVSMPTRVTWNGTTNVTKWSVSNTASNLVYVRCYPSTFTGGPVNVYRYIRATRVN